MVATLVASWFAIAANQPAVFGCTMLAGGAAQHSAHAMAMAGMDMPADTPADTPAPDSHVPRGPGSSPQDCCSGFGSCGGAAAVPSATEVGVLVAGIPTDARPFRADARPASTASDVRLPYSNGPPGEIGTA